VQQHLLKKAFSAGSKACSAATANLLHLRQTRAVPAPNPANAATAAPVVAADPTDVAVDAAEKVVLNVAKAAVNAPNGLSVQSAVTNRMPVAANVLKAVVVAAVVATDRKGRARNRVWMKQSWQKHKTRQLTTLTATQASVLPVRHVNAAKADAVAVAAVNAHPQVRLITPRQPKTHRQRRVQPMLSHKPQTLRALNIA
jgi:hypothetical protein